MNPEDFLLLVCVNPQFLQKEIDSQLKSTIDWNHFLESAIHNGLAPLAYHAFSKLKDKSAIPQSTFNELQKYYYKNLSKNTVLYFEFNNIVSALNDNGIRAVALKGIFLADKIYENIGLRQLSDIDILVHAENAETAANILKENGFESDIRKTKSKLYLDMMDTKHLEMLFKNGVGVEIHKRVINTDNAFDIPLKDFWGHTLTTTIVENKVLAFDAHFQLLHICMHLDEHFVAASMHFIGYVDILWIIEKYKIEIDWKFFDEICVKYNCMANAYPHLYLSCKYLGATIPDFLMLKAQTFCNQYHDEYFINKLQCNHHFVPIERNRNVYALKKIRGIKPKILFLLEDLFPSKRFMIYRYNIKNQRIYYWYYLVRLLGGVVSLFKYIFRIKSA